MADLLVHERLYRGEALLKTIKDIPIVVCGCGAVGSNLIVNLFRQGFERVSVIDKDRIEAHNLNNQIWDLSHVGNMKAQMMKAIIANSLRIPLSAFDKPLDETNIDKVLKGAFIVIDAFDNSKSRRLLKDYCSSKNINCLHIGLNTDYAEVVWNEVYRVPSDVDTVDVCEYPLARNICMLSVVIASEVLINFISEGKKVSKSITLRDFKVTDY